MSYARFSEGDVYVWAASSSEYHCQCCRLMPRDIKSVVGGYMHGDTVAGSPAEMLAHLKAHRAAGHSVPDRALSRLQAEVAEATE